MLLSFRALNHKSLRDEQQLLLTPQYPADQPEGTEWAAAPVTGIFGPNAAGKSNVLDALRYMRDMVLRSHRESEPGGGIGRFAFALDTDIRAGPSRFVVDFLDPDRVHYTYGFAVDDERVVEEWLYSYPKAYKRVIFQRTGDDYEYGEKSSPSLKQVAQITDSNVLLLSVAARSRQELIVPAYDWFSSITLRFPGTRIYPRLLNWRLEEEEFRGRLTTLLRAADVGIEDVELLEPDAEQLALFEADIAELSPEARERRLRMLKRERMQLGFAHRSSGGKELLTLRDQSLGTQALLQLGVSALTALERGSVLAVDELDASLHPYLSAEVIRLFQDPEVNGRIAQLVFTSHDATLLGRIEGTEVLQRDQIWFVEKDEAGATELYPLSDFRPRREENRERRYLAGRYGAVPDVQEETFKAALTTRKDVPNDETRLP